MQLLHDIADIGLSNFKHLKNNLNINLIVFRRYGHYDSHQPLATGPVSHGFPSPGPTKASMLLPSPGNHDAHKYRVAKGVTPHNNKSYNRALLGQFDSSAPMHVATHNKSNLRESRQFVKSEEELLEILPKK